MTASHFLGNGAGNVGKTPGQGVVEIGLLLPANRVAALVELSRERHQTVGQILRDLIDRALADEQTA